MSEEFVAEYIQDSLLNGYQRPADIRKRAENDIIAINEKIKEIEELSNQRTNLRAVIRHLGGGTKTRHNTEKVMDFSMSWDDIDDSFKELCIFIIRYIEQSGERKLPSQILDAVTDRTDTAEQRAAYSAIKWLENNGAFNRLETKEGRCIIKGPRWDFFAGKLDEN